MKPSTSGSTHTVASSTIDSHGPLPHEKSLLIVDDEQSILDGLARILHSSYPHWEILCINDPFEAVASLRERSFDIALIDIKMPGMSGLDVLSTFGELPLFGRPEAIMMTAYSDQKLKQDALGLGAVDLLNKPILKEDLIARVSSAMRCRDYVQGLLIRTQQLEEALLSTQRMDLVGMMAGGAIHDLKNHLTGLLGYTELLLGKTQKGLQTIDSAGRQAAHLVEEIQRLSKNGPSEPIPCDVADVISQCLAIVRSTISEKIHIHWEPPESLPSLIIEEIHLYQVLLNLCVNAGKAMPDGGTLTIEASVETADENGIGEESNASSTSYVTISVTDTGCGIPESVRTDILLPGITSRADAGGTGFGLWVVNTILENCGGLLEIDSAPGEGTCMKAYFPFQNDSKTNA